MARWMAYINNLLTDHLYLCLERSPHKSAEHGGWTGGCGRHAEARGCHGWRPWCDSETDRNTASCTCVSKNLDAQPRLFLVGQMWKKCTPLWRQAHLKPACAGHFWASRYGPAVDERHSIVAQSTFQVKSMKNWGVLSSFGCIKCLFVDR